MRLHYKKVGTLKDATGWPFNPRGLPGDVSELQEQIAEHGQRTAISVTQPNERGVHIVTRGHRRKQAIDNLRAEARKKVREYAVILENLADSTSSDHNDNDVIKMTELWNEAKDEVERWSYYDVTLRDIEPGNLIEVLADMDAGIIQEPVNPIAYGETILYRMDKLGWTLKQCYDSLGLSEQKARACVRAADPNQTAEAVRTALRTGDMSLTMFIKRVSKMDMVSQQRMMKVAAERAEGKNASGVLTPSIINAVIADMTGEAEMPEAPDSAVLPLIAEAKDKLYMALGLRRVWSVSTTESASWLLEEILLLIGNEFKEQERGA